MPQQTRNIRIQSDLQYIMFHQSGHTFDIRGEEINKGYVQGEKFGIPQDIIVNTDGTIDLSPRWIRAGNSNQYTIDVPIHTVLKYPIHDIADACPQENMDYVAIHILVVGEFNSSTPTTAQLGTTGRLLLFLTNKLTNFKDIVYHSDYVAISCPGPRFPRVQYWREHFVSA